MKTTVVNIAWQQLYCADKIIFAAYLTNYAGSSANTALVWPPQLHMLKLKMKTNIYYCTFPEMKVAYVQYTKITNLEIQARWFLLGKKRTKS